jgi:hypothetical protein
MKHTEEFQIDCIVEADFDVDVQPMRIEECHGLHMFDDTSYEVDKLRVYIDIAGIQIDITSRLTESELKTIGETLEPIIDL